MIDMVDNKPDELTRLMKELVKWTRFSGKQQLKAMILENLKSDTEKLVYELSDGERSVREIEELTKVSKSRVGSYWEKWLALGIVEESERFQGRMKHICSLDEIGLEVPKTLREPPKAEEGHVMLTPETVPEDTNNPSSLGES